MTTPNDERQTDSLGRYWNEVVEGGPAMPDDLDPALAATVRRIQAFGTSPTLDPAFAARLWEDLMNQAQTASMAQPHPVSVADLARRHPAAPGVSRRSEERRRGVGRWWPRLEFAAAALLVVALAGSLVVLNGGVAERLGSFGAGDDPGEETTLPTLLKAVWVRPPDQGPVDVVLRRVTAEPGATWEMPPGFTINFLESGILVMREAVSGAKEQRMRANTGFSGDYGAMFRNDGSEPAVLFQAAIGPSVRSMSFPVGVAAEELVGGTADALPAGPALVTVASYALGPGEGDEVDAGRDGLALLVVEAGTVALSGQAGRTELDRAADAGSATEATVDARRQPAAEVPLSAGDTALLQGGAFFWFRNGGQDEVRLLVLTVDPGAAEAQIVAGPSESIAGSVYGTPPPAPPRATPTADAEVVAPEECDVEPRSPESIRALSATGAATPARGEGEIGETPYEDELPQGQPADPALVAMLTEVEREFVACYNAGDLPRVLALLTDEAARELLADLSDEEKATLLTGTPTPRFEDERIGLFPLRGARVLPDGRAGAIVEWAQAGELRMVSESNFRIFEPVDGRWLLAEEISFIPYP